MSRTACILLIAICVLPLAAHAAAYPQKQFIGSWYGEGQPSEKNVYWIDHLNADGTLLSVFRECIKNKPHDLEQSGIWSVEGDKLLTKLFVVDGRGVIGEDDYAITAFTGNKMEYHLLREHQDYTFRGIRVSADYQLPPCDLTS